MIIHIMTLAELAQSKGYNRKRHTPARLICHWDGVLIVLCRFWCVQHWYLRTFQLYWKVFQIGPLVFAFYEPMARCTSPRCYAVQEFGLGKAG